MNQQMQQGREWLERLMAAGTPLFGQFELTGTCNLHCTMCYLDGPGGPGGLSGLDGETWISLMTQARDAGMLFLQLTGGEPLLHPDFRRIVEAVTHLGVYWHLNTNATLMTAELADFLAAKRPSGIQVSLYAASDVVSKALCRSVDGWRKALLGVDRLLARGLKVSLRTTLVQENLFELDALWAEAASRGLSLAWVDIVSPPRGKTDDFMRKRFDEIRLTPDQYAWAAQRFQVLYQRDFPEELPALQQRETDHLAFLLHPDNEASVKERVQGPFGCQAGHSAFSILHDGTLSPCSLMRGPELSVLETGFAEAWNQLRQVCRSMPVNKACLRCKLSAHCSACPARLETEGTAGRCAPYLRAMALSRRLMEQRFDGIEKNR